jgi:hypothetical protein
VVIEAARPRRIAGPILKLPLPVAVADMPASERLKRRGARHNPAELSDVSDEITLQEAAALCGRNLETLRNWIKKQPRLARFDRVARRYLVSKPALVALWIERWGRETLPAGLRD